MVPKNSANVGTSPSLLTSTAGLGRPESPKPDSMGPPDGDRHEVRGGAHTEAELFDASPEPSISSRRNSTSKSDSRSGLDDQPKKGRLGRVPASPRAQPTKPSALGEFALGRTPDRRHTSATLLRDAKEANKARQATAVTTPKAGAALPATIPSLTLSAEDGRTSDVFDLPDDFPVRRETKEDRTGSLADRAASPSRRAASPSGGAHEGLGEGLGDTAPDHTLGVPSRSRSRSGTRSQSHSGVRGMLKGSPRGTAPQWTNPFAALNPAYDWTDKLLDNEEALTIYKEMCADAHTNDNLNFVLAFGQLRTIDNPDEALQHLRRMLSDHVAPGRQQILNTTLDDLRRTWPATVDNLTNPKFLQELTAVVLAVKRLIDNDVHVSHSRDPKAARLLKAMEPKPKKTSLAGLTQFMHRGHIPKSPRGADAKSASAVASKVSDTKAAEAVTAEPPPEFDKNQSLLYQQNPDFYGRCEQAVNSTSKSPVIVAIELDKIFEGSMPAAFAATAAVLKDEIAAIRVATSAHGNSSPEALQLARKARDTLLTAMHTPANS